MKTEGWIEITPYQSGLFIPWWHLLILLAPGLLPTEGWEGLLLYPTGRKNSLCCRARCGLLCYLLGCSSLFRKRGRLIETSNDQGHKLVAMISIFGFGCVIPSKVVSFPNSQYMKSLVILTLQISLCPENLLWAIALHGSAPSDLRS